MNLNIDSEILERCRFSADVITASIQNFIKPRSTKSIERAVCRLLGIEGARNDYPLCNLVIENLPSAALKSGILFWLANAVVQTGNTPSQIAEQIADHRFNLDALPIREPAAILAAAEKLSSRVLDRIHSQRNRRDSLIERFGSPEFPWRYVIVATGNIVEDVVQARAAVQQGANVIAVIRSTAQSLMDYVPEGLTTEGYGGTYATQANFRLMREALDEESARAQQYVRLTNYASGLCMPEIAALGGIERLDMMLSDSMYGVLFRDINMERTFVDQDFARSVQALAGIIINTGEDNYLTTDDAFEAAHTVLASQFINASFAHRAGLRNDQIGLGHAFEMEPQQINGLLYEMADALLSRICFPDYPLKYMPPTRHLTGDIFRAQTMNALFNLTSIATAQSIHLVGMSTEAVHTPFLHDRALALDNVDYVMRYARDFYTEFQPRSGGIMERRANHVLQQAADLLDRIRELGLFSAIEEGLFAGIRRNRSGGRGGDGVFEKDERYIECFPKGRNVQ